MNVGLGTSQKSGKLTHYVILEPSSLDGLFSSHLLHAVIAPGLCMPMILGLPFLTVNKIVCNYAAHQCMATENEPPYNLLLKNKSQIALGINTNRLDILAALKEQIITLSFEEELAAREAEIQTRFTQVFEPPPQVDRLPTKPVAWIILKDKNLSIKSRNYPCPC